MLDKDAAAQPRSISSKCIRTLIADADESLQAVYRETLSQEGFAVTAAYSGLECVARLREYIPDVLVLEPCLPWGGGDGVIARLNDACPSARSRSFSSSEMRLRIRSPREPVWLRTIASRRLFTTRICWTASAWNSV
jgi:hypothetical protein